MSPRAIRAALRAAGLDRESLSALYVHVIGYCPFEDDAETTPEQVVETLKGYADEIERAAVYGDES